MLEIRQLRLRVLIPNNFAAIKVQVCNHSLKVSQLPGLLFVLLADTIGVFNCLLMFGGEARDLVLQLDLL
jgi:hypothetical protein